MNDRRLFREYYSMAVPGIFALENARHKWIYISHTNNILRAMSEVISEISTGTTKYKKLIEHREYLKFFILDKIDNEHDRKLKVAHYIDEYLKDGYKLYIKKRPIVYQIKVEVHKDFNVNNSNMLVYVFARKKSGIKTTVGVFDNMDEAKLWVENTYRDKTQIIPIIAENTLTKEYMEYIKSNG